MYKARLEKKKRSDRTIADYRQKFGAHLAPTFGRVALRDITRADVVRLHDRLTSEVGPYAANGVCRVGHAIYRHAALGMEVPELSPLNPFRAYDLHNPRHRARPAFPNANFQSGSRKCSRWTIR